MAVDPEDSVTAAGLVDSDMVADLVASVTAADLVASVVVMVDSVDMAADLVDSAVASARVDTADSVVDMVDLVAKVACAHRPALPVVATGARPLRDKTTAAKTTPKLPRTQ